MDEIKVTHIELHFIEDLGFTEFMDFPLRHMYGSDGMVRIPGLERCQCCHGWPRGGSQWTVHTVSVGLLSS